MLQDFAGHTLAEVERDLIISMLAHFDGNRTRAAEALAISIRTLRNKLHEYRSSGLDLPEPRTRAGGPIKRDCSGA